MTDASFRVHVVDLRKRVGERRDISRTYATPELRVAESVVANGTEVNATLEIESIHGGGIVATGSLETVYTGECRRCLEQIEGQLHVEVREIFEQHPVEGETYSLDGDDIDLVPLVHESLMLALPLSPLCDDACAGPAPERFPAEFVRDDEPHDERPRDPRWAALSGLTFDE